MHLSTTQQGKNNDWCRPKQHNNTEMDERLCTLEEEKSYIRQQKEEERWTLSSNRSG